MLDLHPLQPDTMGCFLTISHDAKARTAALRAAGALKLWAATVDAVDLLRHAATNTAPLEWLARVERQYLDQAQLQRLNRDQSHAVSKVDASARHLHDSAAMTLAGWLEEDAKRARSQILHATRTATEVEELLRRQGFSAEDVQQTAARTTLGINQWRAQEAREGIAAAEARVANVDQMLSTLTGSGAAVSAPAFAEMQQLRDRLEAEADQHRAQLAEVGDVARRLESLAAELRVPEGDAQLNLLAATIARAQTAAAVATCRLNVALAEHGELNAYLSDPLRSLDRLSEGLRIRLLENSHATRNRKPIIYPRKLR